MKVSHNIKITMFSSSDQSITIESSTKTRSRATTNVIILPSVEPTTWLEFNGVKSYVYDLYLKTNNRPLLPQKRENKLTIPGRNGAYDFGNGKYDETIIDVTFTYKGKGETLKKQRANTLQTARSVAQWLKNKGVLRFYDEPTRYYIAEIYNNIDMNFLNFTLLELNIVFKCEPFAYVTDDVVTSIDELLASNYIKTL